MADIPELARAWVAGWVVTRGTPGPVEVPWGLRVDVGLPGHLVRHVTPETLPETVRAAAGAAAETGPGTWIKGFEEPAVMARWLAGTGTWEPDAPGWLMTTALRRAAASAPDGYRLVTETTPAGVTHARVLAGDGTPAAWGRIAVTGTTAVVDQVETAAGHRRRGLGTVVLRTLATTAAERGADTGILGATADGRALYETLGWRAHGPLTGFVRR
jgi:GNAT superfamily N-acetyltransferase